LLFALCKIGYQNTKAEQSLEIKPIKRNIKILIAEDNQFNLDIIYDYLLSNNYQLLVARNGKQALELAVEEKPDLILMDIQMPGMDGLEATRLIRVRDELKDIPIIALTALAMQGDKERCLQAGMNDYISKPINFKKLLEMIKHFYPE
jgi:CheY-like chemotaxis protein